MSTPTSPLAVPQGSVLSRVNAYVKHAISVALGVAVSEGILDPATNTVHISGLHAVYLVLIATGVSLVSSYAGLGATAAPKVVYLGTVAAPDAPAATTGAVATSAMPSGQPGYIPQS